MKTVQLAAIALIFALGATSAQARGAGKGETIEVGCTGDGARMNDIARAVENTSYWVPQAARRRMLALARRACSLGAEVVTFLPPPDQRSCRTPPTWSTLCVDQAAILREVADSSIPPALPAHE